MQKKDFVSYKVAMIMATLGFNNSCYAYYNEMKEICYFTPYRILHSNNSVVLKEGLPRAAAATLEQAIKWLDDKGLNVDITPEYYTDGINWNYQVFWFLPKEQQVWTEPTADKLSFPILIHDGTGMYGDNNEFPKRHLAEKAGIEHAIKILEQGKPFKNLK